MIDNMLSFAANWKKSSVTIRPIRIIRVPFRFAFSFWNTDGADRADYHGFSEASAGDMIMPCQSLAPHRGKFSHAKHAKISNLLRKRSEDFVFKLKIKRF